MEGTGGSTLQWSVAAALARSRRRRKLAASTTRRRRVGGRRRDAEAGGVMRRKELETEGNEVGDAEGGERRRWTDGKG
jgi:hypothetical protein